ncbi:YbfB/YjiJ family MFS transporter [Rhodococcus tukisamuensis]|uniref:Predicted arabinose efflux permease, MFS family n=1 Tax=Rhodococcus tukisamuensis TaxID=168276 RepID=A0A1G7CJK7_9NOCA|nr:YbfB/YjiJ family MFS transporter [Rhodococcus tukisamuensis]SDE39499.1 Predicted arabinose efflux permease, MFS family [Rhodococcus tukisamuensis]
MVGLRDPALSGTHGRLLVLRASVALVVAMGLGRFAYTPILPLMEQQAGLSGESAATMATVNYLGYLLGAVLATFLPVLTRSRAALRVSLVALIATLAAMPLTQSLPVWLTLRGLAGLASAVVFVFTARVAHQELSGRRDGAGWVFGGVGGGIALSGLAILALGADADWRTSWLVVAALAAALSALSWTLPGGRPQPHAVGGAGRVPRRNRVAFGWLLAAYFCEGLGYIISATFLVAAVASLGSATWLGSVVWIAVGLAVVPSCVFWMRLSRRHSQVTMLTVAMTVQAAAVAASAVSGSAVVQVLGALCFGGTMIAIVTLALAEGTVLVGARAPAIATAVYGVGQVIGPLMVAPLLDGGYTPALAVGAVVLAAGVLFTLPLLRMERRAQAHPRATG